MVRVDATEKELEMDMSQEDLRLILDISSHYEVMKD